MTDISARLDAAVTQNPAHTRTGLLERLFARLFQGLVYAQIWEDPVVDMAALAIRPTDRIVCIASGGCNMMSYLTASPAHVTAVDLSPAHVALGRLKLAAARTLDQGDFYGFFGTADRSGNPALYDRVLAPVLDPATRAWWEGGGLSRRITMFARGVHRFGLLGRFIGAAHLIAALCRVDFRPLLAAKPSPNSSFFDRKIAPLFDNRIVRTLARSRAALFGLGIPPAQYDKLAADGGGDVLPVLRERTRRLVCDFPIARNYFAAQAFARCFLPGPPGALPPYLEPDAFPALQKAAERAEVLNLALTDQLATLPAASTDCYVLLDAQDWMTDAQLNALWQEITRTAAPGARVIFRTGGADDILPGRVAAGLLGRWAYDAAASARGHAADRSAIYGGFHLYRLKEGAR